MKSIFKKNQIMITALAIMLAVAGYLNFAGTKLEEEDYLPASNDVLTEDTEELDLTGMLDDLSEEDLATADIESMDSDIEVVMEDYLDEEMDVLGQTVAGETPQEGEVPGEAVFTSTANVAMLSEAKLLKEQTRAKNKETLLDIINSTELSDAQKQTAVDSMIELTGIAEKEMAAEILLEAKGFSDVVVSLSDGCVDVVINAEQLTDAQRAQIEDIVKRKTEVSAENIIISTVVQ